MLPFWLLLYTLTLSLCLASYFGYPLVIWAIGRIKPFKAMEDDDLPSVSLIIPAYNESRNIEKKIQNTLELDYPREKIEILIGSDGSSDETSKMVEKYAGRAIKFFDFKTNRGKTAVQNDLVAAARGEVLIFTDAACFMGKKSIRNIVRRFADPRVGCVAGRMEYVATDQNLTTQSQGLYWRYETKLRELESGLGRLIGVDGPLYAVRHEYCDRLEDHVISDFITPLLVLEKGKQAVLADDAVVYEDPTRETAQEFSTRRRITLRGLAGLYTYRRLLNPIKHPFLASQIFFHKILRWYVGVLVVLNVVACLAMANVDLFKVIFLAYLLFFLAAALGWALERSGVSFRVLTVPYYFVLVNAAATAGIIDFFRKKQAVTWKPVRD